MSVDTIAAAANDDDNDNDDLDKELEALFDGDDANGEFDGVSSGGGREIETHEERPCTPPPQETRQESHGSAPNGYSAGTEVLVPASPERKSRDSNADSAIQKKSIIGSLLARKHTLRLTSHASKILSDAESLIERNQAQQQQQQKQQPQTAQNATSSERYNKSSLNALSKKRSKLEQQEQERQRQASEEEVARRAKKARHSFRVLKTEGEASGSRVYDVDVANVSNMKLKRCPVDAMRLNSLFELVPRVDLAAVGEEETKRTKLEWVTFGVLVKKHAKKETAQQSKYSVWSIYNMPTFTAANKWKPLAPTCVTLLLFEEAFATFHMLPEGSAIALRKPIAMPPREEDAHFNNNGSDNGSVLKRNKYCLKISKAAQLMKLGLAKDFALCTQPDGFSNAQTCAQWYDRSRMDMCVRHMQAKRRRLVSGSRMDVNNAERPNNYGSNPNYGGATPQYDSLTSVEARHRHQQDQKRIKGLQNRRAQQLAHTQGALSSASKMSLKDHLVRDKRQQPQKVPTNANQHLAPMSFMRQKQQLVHHQSVYNQAVDTLLSIGFRLTVDGDLIAPSLPSQQQRVTLQRGRMKSVRQNLTHPAASAAERDRRESRTERVKDREKEKDRQGRRNTASSSTSPPSTAAAVIPGTSSPPVDKKTPSPERSAANFNSGVKDDGVNEEEDVCLSDESGSE